MSDPMDGHLQPVLSDDEIRALDDATHFHESLDWTLRFARAVEQRVIAALAAREGQDAYGGVRDLRDATWLDPECADRGACQSLRFKAAPPAPSQGAREAMMAAADWLTSDRIGDWRYMEGSAFYEDARKHADALRAALAQGEAGR